MKILYLYSELAGYQIPIFRELSISYNGKVVVIHWGHILKLYTPPAIKNVEYHLKSEFKVKELEKFASELSPDLVYVSGWMDKDYLKIAKKFKKCGIPVISGFDDIWFGNLKQKVGALIFPYYFKKYFSHAWVAGAPQYEFARRLGFSSNEIIFDLLSANTDKFCLEARKDLIDKQQFSKAFIYVGNFRKRKGTDLLIKAFNIYRNELKGEWHLICIGNGDMLNIVKNNNHVKIHPFSDEDTIIKISRSAAAFILPSRHDQWGVVVHEFSALGMPLILSDNVGASSSFLIEGFNGYKFKNLDIHDLAKKMKSISDLSDMELARMSRNSNLLSRRINISSATANLMSLIKY